MEDDGSGSGGASTGGETGEAAMETLVVVAELRKALAALTGSETGGGGEGEEGSGAGGESVESEVVVLARAVCSAAERVGGGEGVGGEHEAAAQEVTAAVVAAERAKADARAAGERVEALEAALAGEKERREAAERRAEEERAARVRAGEETGELNKRIAEAYMQVRETHAEKDALQARVRELMQRLPETEAERREMAAQLAAIQGELEEARQWAPAGIASSIASFAWSSAVSTYQLVSDGVVQFKDKTRSKPGVYTEYEKEQMQTVVQYFSHRVTSELPDILHMVMDETEYYPATPAAEIPTSRDYRFAEWTHKIGEGPLAGPAKALIKLVCEYQSDRAARFYGIAGCGYADDPINLTLRETKDWLAMLSSCDKSEQTRLDIARRIAFYDDLLANQVFPTSRRSASSMVDVLTAVVNELEDLVLHWNDDEVGDLLADAFADPFAALAPAGASSSGREVSGPLPDDINDDGFVDVAHPASDDDDAGFDRGDDGDDSGSDGITFL